MLKTGHQREHTDGVLGGKARVDCHVGDTGAALTLGR